MGRAGLFRLCVVWILIMAEILLTVSGRTNPGHVGAKNVNPAPGLGGGHGGDGGGGALGGGVPGVGTGNGCGGVFGGVPFAGIIGGGAGIYRPYVVCSDPGPCYNKRLTCPESCFRSAGGWGPNGGGGGGGGGCTLDCNRKCRAYC